MASNSRYTIISADGHCGADLLDYKPYLERQWHDEFEDWAASYVSPFGDLQNDDADRNWNSERRLRELEADGIVAEVLFPNTVPPFFPSGNLLAPLPTAAEYQRRMAGLRAHNRWLADFCAQAPERRAGIGQVLLHDIDETLAEIDYIASAGLRGGVLLPIIAPGSGLRPLFDPMYDPVWQRCEELGLPITQHGGSGIPSDYDPRRPEDRALMLVELPIYGHRGMFHLIFAGVFERHPDLKMVLTEQGTGWIPRTLESLDWFLRRMKIEDAPEHIFGGEVAARLSLTPSEYFARNCWVGASFIRPVEAALKHDIGIDRIMWGSDFPHTEGSYPYTTEALRYALADATEAEMRMMLAGNAAAIYGFDLASLTPIGDRIGPLVTDVAKPLPHADVPSDATCNAFDPDAVVRAW